MSFASIRAIAMRWRGCSRFRSCPRAGGVGRSTWFNGGEGSAMGRGRVVVVALLVLAATGRHARDSGIRACPPVIASGDKPIVTVAGLWDARELHLRSF